MDNILFPEMHQVYSTEITESLITIRLLRAYICRLNFPFPPEIMKFNAIICFVGISAKWYFQKPNEKRI